MIRKVMPEAAKRLPESSVLFGFRIRGLRRRPIDAPGAKFRND
jgi:hypothetical protein